MADSEEEDFMSDKFLNDLEDICPGISMKPTARREFEMDIKKAEADMKGRSKKRKFLEHEARDEGLSKPLDTTNKGFQLLQKMGFKSGMSIGQPKQDAPTTSKPLTEPIKIDFDGSIGRAGLGMKAKQEEERTKRVKLHIDHHKTQAKQIENLTNEFVEAKRSKFKDKLTVKDLSSSRRVCYELDSTNGINEPIEKGFWPWQVIRDMENANDSNANDLVDNVSDSELDECPYKALENVTAYLRSSYFYCIWCQVRYDNLEDLQNSCPGPSRELHSDD